MNNGTCIDGVNTFHCECLRGHTGRNCQIKVDYEEYARTDLLDREVCRKNRCDEKAGNGVCDVECSFFACDYDGGDCSAKNHPFEKCALSSFCAHNFHNDRCDPVSLEFFSEAFGTRQYLFCSDPQGMFLGV